MENIKDILHELRCDIACIPRTEDNKEEIKNATQTLQKAWELVKESDSLPCVSDCHEAKVAEYWHQRCKKAEAYINESPCDPDITDTQLKAWREYQDFIDE